MAGTHTVADCLTDALCDTSPLTDDFGFAHRGAVEASAWLCAEYGESLKYLEDTRVMEGHPGWAAGALLVLLVSC